MDIISLWWSENFYKDKIRLYYSPDYVCEDVDDEEDDGREMIYQYDIIGSEEPDLDIEYRDYRKRKFASKHYRNRGGEYAKSTGIDNPMLYNALGMCCQRKW